MMKHPDAHLSDEQLLLDMEGELSAREQELVHAHLPGCWTCRARRQELESALRDFVHLKATKLDPAVPAAAGARALLKARLAEANPAGNAISRRRLLACSAAFAMLLLGTVSVSILLRTRERARHEAQIYYVPDARLTPGATVLFDRSFVCSAPGQGNKAVPVALQQQVFAVYGIPKADPRAYEVDYLVTPALGGAEDIHNLWPHSHSTVWNAQVKDALEDRLRELVCNGSLDLAEAQQEIATNWISAYKRYFHTDVPLPEHRGYR